MHPVRTDVEILNPLSGKGGCVELAFVVGILRIPYNRNHQSGSELYSHNKT